LRHLPASFGEHAQRIGALLDGADDVSVHTVAIIARIVGRDLTSVIVVRSVLVAAEVGRRSRAVKDRTARGQRARGDVSRVAVVPCRAANSVQQDGCAPFYLKHAVLLDAGRIVPDAVAELARIGGIRRDLGSISIENVVDEASFRLAQSDGPGRRRDRRRRASCCRHCSSRTAWHGHIHEWDGKFGTSDDGAALARLLLDRAVLPDRSGKGTHLEETHEHRVVTGAIEARFVRDDPVPFVVVLEHVVAS